MKRNIFILFVCFLVFFIANLQAIEEIQVSVEVVGTVFSLSLQDSSGAPFRGSIDFGSVKPGQSSFPEKALVVASCKANTGRPWHLLVNATPLKDQRSGVLLEPENIAVYIGNPKEQGQAPMPGRRYATGQNPLRLSKNDTRIYSSNEIGDAGFGGGWGTYLPVGFGLTIPATQKQGYYNGVITITMTE